MLPDSSYSQSYMAHHHEVHYGTDCGACPVMSSHRDGAASDADLDLDGRHTCEDRLPEECGHGDVRDGRSGGTAIRGSVAGQAGPRDDPLRG